MTSKLADKFIEERYLVTIQRPAELGVQDAKLYLVNAINGWSKALRPSDPLWSLECKSALRLTEDRLDRLVRKELGMQLAPKEERESD